MFRRKRHASHAAVNPNPSPSAQTAAVQAFRASKSSSSNANLSSAAAAAAIRKHPTSPTSVEDVQTKRTLQRQLSDSSAGSAASLPQRRGEGSGHAGHDGTLRRSRSSGSMTTRSFRNSSPTNIGPVGRQNEIIPVPPIPDAYVKPRASHHQRTASLQSPPFRAISPPGKAGAARASSLDESPGKWRTDKPGAAQVTDPTELERRESRGSINFSYPMNARPNSPRQRSSSEGYRLDNDSSYGSSQASPPPIQPTKQSVRAGQDQGAQGVQKKVDSDTQKAVAHPSSADMHGRTAHHNQHNLGSEASRQRKDLAQSSTGSYRDRHETDKISQKPPAPEPNKDVDPSRRETSRAPVETHDLRIPKRRPSTVHESTEEHGEGHDAPLSSSHSRPKDDHKAIAREETESAPSAKPRGGVLPESGQIDHPHVPSAPAFSLQEQPDTITSGQHRKQNSRGTVAQRTPHAPDTTTSQSPSPNRATRFSDRLQVANQGDHLHEPPPPSKIPGKPALKRSTSQSRSPDRSLLPHERAAEIHSETSENNSITSDEALTTRQNKKPAKVSFDDEVGVRVSAASPHTSSGSAESPSPQSSLPTFAGRTRPKAQSDVDGFDDILKPRPTLPSFGSIRGRRRFADGEPESYPDKTHGNRHAATETSFSNDHALGAALSNDTSRRAVSNDQSESNLPLPPEVTSVEGSGFAYSSEESSDSDRVDDPESFAPSGDRMDRYPLRRKAVQEERGANRAEEKSTHEAVTHDQQLHHDNVPTISVQPATPHLEDGNQSTKRPGIPGAFPAQYRGSADSSGSFAMNEATVPRPTQTAERPSPSIVTEADSRISAQATAPPSDLTTGDDTDGDSESGESVYSDAAEDLSELDGDGFGSINAIVDSPVSKGRKSALDSTIGGPTTDPRHDQSRTRAVDGDYPLGTSSGAYLSSPGPESYPTVEQSSHDAADQSGNVSSVRDQSSALGTPEYSPHPPQKSVTTKYSSKPTDSSNRHEQQGTAIANQNFSTIGDELTASQRQSRKQQDYQAHQKPVSIPTDTAVAGPSASVVPKKHSANVPGTSEKRETEPPTNGQLQRTLSNGSDSSSSFKRMRTSPRATGHHSLRLTLRDGQRNSATASPSSEMSPASPNQRRPFSSETGQSGMRTTLRDSPNGKLKKTSIFSGAKQKGPTESRPFPKRNLFSGSRQKTGAKEKGQFRSRFDDSSDDEYEMVDLRPVRGIPRRRGEVDGDSTELEDSSDGESQRRAVNKNRSSGSRPAAAGAPALAAAFADAANTNRQGNPADFLREQRKQKSRLLSRLTPSKGKHRNEGVGIRKSDLESAARRDTPLERSRLDLEKAKATTTTNPPATTTNVAADRPKIGSQFSSKLQKRVSGRFTSGPWRLQSNNNNVTSGIPTSVPEADQQPPSTPPPVAGKEEDRPHTSDGIAAANNTSASPRSRRFLPKLQMHGRHDAGGGSLPKSPLSDGGHGDLGGAKRNRFPMLKKALGIRRFFSASRALYPGSRETASLLVSPFESPFERHSRKDAQRTVNLDFDARVPIPFSVFPSSYRSDAVSETTHSRVEGEVQSTGASRVGREDTYEGRRPDPRAYGKEEVDVDVSVSSDYRPARPPRTSSSRRYEEDAVYQERYPEVELSRERYYDTSRDHRPPIENQVDITEREYRRRTDPAYEVDWERHDRNVYDVDPHQQARRRSEPAVDYTDRRAVFDESSHNNSKMGYYDDEGHYHSFRRGVERAADRVRHPIHHHERHHRDDDHHHHDAHEDHGPSHVREGVRENVRVVRPRGGHPPDTITIPCHFIRVGDLLILQGRPCQVIRVSVSSQTGQHRYLGVDIFTGQLQEESSFVSNPSPSVVVQSMLGPVYKTYRILDLHDDGYLTAMTETGNVKQGLRVIDQGNLFNRISDAFADGRGSIRALVINDGGRELVVDYKVIHGSRL